MKTVPALAELLLTFPLQGHAARDGSPVTGRGLRWLTGWSLLLRSTPNAPFLPAWARVGGVATRLLPSHAASQASAEGRRKARTRTCSSP